MLDLRNKTFTKLVSTLLTLSFLTFNSSYGSVDTRPSMPKEASSAISGIEDISIPGQIGQIKERHNGKDKSIIIHIQDAHCNYEAQSNIARIIETLVKDHNVKLVAVEGADGLVDTTWFKAFPDPDIRKEVADYFMKKGEITGAEFLSITSDYPFSIYGIEDKKYYLKNLNCFLESYPYKEEFIKYYDGIKNQLSQLKKYIYTKELSSLDNEVSKHKGKDSKFADYVKFLSDQAAAKGVNTSSYENFSTLLETLKIEKDINFDIVNDERAKLIDELSKKISKDELSILVAKSLDFKMGKIDGNSFYAYLADLAGQNEITLAKSYNNLAKYIVYTRIYSRINNEKLFDEIDHVVASLKEKMFVNEDQRMLDELWTNVNIMIGFINIEIANKEHEYYKAHKDNFDPQRFVSFIREKSSKYGLNDNVQDPPSELSYIFPKLVEFYEVATVRDNIIVNNTYRYMKGTGTNVAILITGGFHTKGITKLLEQKDSSYVVVSPMITKDAESPYLSVLTGQKTPFEELLVQTSKENKLAPPYLCDADIIDTLSHAMETEKGRQIAQRLQEGHEASLREFARLFMQTVVQKYPDTSKDTLYRNMLLNFDQKCKDCKLEPITRKVREYLSDRAVFDAVYDEVKTNATKKAPNAAALTHSETLTIEKIIAAAEATENGYTDINIAQMQPVMQMLAALPAEYSGTHNLLSDIASGNVKIRALDLGQVQDKLGMPGLATKLGFPRQNPLDREIYSYAKPTGSFGQIVIYTTQNFAFLSDPYYNEELEKYPEGKLIIERAYARLAQLLVHEYTEMILGKTHAQASEAEMLVLSKDPFAQAEQRLDNVSDLTLFALDAAANDGDATYLMNILKEYDPKKDRRDQPFRKAVVNALSDLFTYYLTAQDVNDARSDLTTLYNPINIDDTVITPDVLNSLNVSHYVKEALGLADLKIKKSIENALTKREIDKKQDLRGNAAECFTAEVVYRLAQAYGNQLAIANPNEKDLQNVRLYVAVGRDARVTGPRIRDIVARGLNDMGIDVVDLCPGNDNTKFTTTPMLGFAISHDSNLDGGIQLTASHLEAPYNGIKMYIGADNIPEDTLRNKVMTDAANDASYQKFTTLLGTVHPKEDIIEEYKAHLESYMREKAERLTGRKADQPLVGKTIVVDPGNGTGTVFIDVAKRLGAKVIALNSTPNGYFPNHISDPNNKTFKPAPMAALSSAVLANNADLGFSFDSDADRWGAVTKDGKQVTGHQALMYLSDKALDAAPGATIVANNRATAALKQLVEAKGGRYVMAPTGYTRVIDSINEQVAAGYTVALGGEESLHVMSPENGFRDDGVFAAAMVTCMLSAETKGLDQILAGYAEKYNFKPEKTVRLTITSTDALVCDQVKAEIESKVLGDLKSAGIPDSAINTDDGIWVYFDDLKGWALIRGSLSEKQIFGIDFECEDKANVLLLAEKIAAMLNPIAETGKLDMKNLDKFIAAQKSSAVGKLVEDGCIVKDLRGTVTPDGRSLSISDARGKELTSVSILGAAEKEKLQTTIDTIREFVAQAKGLDSLDKQVTEGILKLLQTAADEGRIYLIKENAEHIFGFSDGNNIYIAQSLINNPVLLFHEAGEAYFAVTTYRDGLGRLGHGVSAHTYLRGIGYKARIGARPLTDEEGQLRSSLGLQDRIFGKYNDELTELLASSKLELLGEEIASAYRANPLHVREIQQPRLVSPIYSGDSRLIVIKNAPAKGGFIYLGLNTNYLSPDRISDRLAIEKAIKSGDNQIVQHYFNKVPVSEEDVFFVPAGTFYAIGPDVTYVEVVNTVDRNIKHPYAKTVEGTYRQIPRVIGRWEIPNTSSGWTEWRLYYSDTFWTSQVDIKGPTVHEVIMGDTYQLVTAVKGDIEVTYMNADESVSTIVLTEGQTFFAEAGLLNYHVKPLTAQASFLKTFIPEVSHEKHPVHGNLDMIDTLHKLHMADIRPRLVGRDLTTFRTNSALKAFLTDHCVVKNMSDINNVWLGELAYQKAIDEKAKKPLQKTHDTYMALFGKKEAADINVTMIRGGRGGAQFTRSLAEMQNVGVTVILSGTDDGRSWFYGAQEFNATGIPDIRKTLTDYLNSKPDLAKYGKLNEERFAAKKDITHAGVTRSKKLVREPKELVDELLKVITKIGNPDLEVDFVQDAGGDKIWEHLSNTSPEFRQTVKPYIVRVYNELQQRRLDPTKKFTLENVPFGTLLFLGVKLTLEDKNGKGNVTPQQYIDLVMDIYNVNKGKFNIVTAAKKQVHLMGMLQDGTIFLTETGINEYRRTAPFYGLWLVSQETTERLLKAGDIAGIDIKLMEEFKNAKEGSKDHEIYQTVRMIDVPDGQKPTSSQLKKVADFIRNASVTADLSVNAEAKAALENADMILLLPTTNFSNMNPALTVGEISGAYLDNRHAFKVWFMNMAKDSCDELGDFYASDVLEGIVRSANGTLDGYKQDGAWWADAHSVTSFVIGNSPEFAGLAEKRAAVEDRKEYAILDARNITENSNGTVTPVAMKLENPSSAEVKRIDYSQGNLFGYYDPNYMLDALFSLFNLAQIGVTVNSHGQLVDSPRSVAKGSSLTAPAKVINARDIAEILVEARNPVRAASALFEGNLQSEDVFTSVLANANNIALEAAKSDVTLLPLIDSFNTMVIEAARNMPKERAGLATKLQILSGQARNIVSWSTRGVAGASAIRLTTNELQMVKSGKGLSYLNSTTMPVEMTTQEGAPGFYYRGAEKADKMGLENTPFELTYDSTGRNDKWGHTVLYLMDHGWMPVPAALTADTTDKKVTTIHETSFLANMIPGTTQFTSTGPGHFQGTSMDIKYVTEGYGIQYNKFYDANGRLVSVYAQYLKPGSWAIAFPGAVDSIENLGGLRFNDFSINLDMAKETDLRVINTLMVKFNPDVSFPNVQTAFTSGAPELKASVSKVPYFSEMISGTPMVALNPAVQDVPQIIWTADFQTVFGSTPMTTLYENLTPETLENIKLGILSVINSAEWLKPKNRMPSETIEIKHDQTHRYNQAYIVLSGDVKEGRAVNFMPLFKRAKDGYTWGEPVQTSSILELMGYNTLDSKVKAIISSLDTAQTQSYRKAYDEAAKTQNVKEFNEWLEDTITAEVTSQSFTKNAIGERWFFAGMIQNPVGFQPLPISALAPFAQEIYGADHVALYGPEAGITNKHLTSSMPLSLQIHEFSEMIIPLEDGYAYMGSSKDISRDNLEKELRSGRDIQSLLNKVPLKKGVPVIVPAGMPHAYGVVRVYEIKAVNAAQDAKGTISFFDRLKLIERGDLTNSADVMDRSDISTAERGKILADNNWSRPRKDFATMFVKKENGDIDFSQIDEAEINRILDVLDKYHSFRKVNPSDYEFQPITVDKKEGSDITKTEVTGITSDFVSLRYSLGLGDSLQADEFLAQDRAFHVLFVAQGSIDIVDEKGNRIYSLKEGEEKVIYRNEFLRLGRYTMKAVNTKPGEPAVVYTQYRPLRAERMVYTAFDAVKSNLAAIQQNKVRLLSEGNMFSGDARTPGSISYEKRLLSNISNGSVSLVDWSNTERLLDLLKSREDGIIDVVQLTKKTFDNISADIKAGSPNAAQLKKVLSDTRIIVAPDVPDTKKSIAFVREIEVAGVILGNTTKEDIDNRTPMAKWLLDVMSQLTGNKDLSWTHLSSLLAAGAGEEGLTKRINTLITHLLISMPAEAYDVDKAIRARREVIWSV